jgi:polysaccharide export outer membrane protein
MAGRREGCPDRLRIESLGALALAVLLTISEPAPAEQTSGTEAYTLAAGDRVTVTVVGQTDLSGDVLIDDAGNVTMPFIGTVQVAGLTVIECQKLIRDHLADGFIRQPVVSVRVSEPRPIYILGDVHTPGMYPFRYGSTVKSVAALAGGFGNADARRGAGLAEVLIADGQLRQLEFEQATLLIRRARLEAQRDGQETVKMPALAVQLSQRDFTGLVDMETSIMSHQSKLLKQQLDLLDAQKPRIESELAALQQQIANGQKRLERVKEEASRSAQLVKQGLGVRAPEVQLELEEASETGELWQLTAQVSRLQMDRGDLDIRMQDLQANFQREILTELEAVYQRLAELRGAIDAAHDVRELRLQESRTAFTQSGHSISITRTRGSRVVVLQGSDRTTLEPGDVVEVTNTFAAPALRAPASDLKTP